MNDVVITVGVSITIVVVSTLNTTIGVYVNIIGMDYVVGINIVRMDYVAGIPKVGPSWSSCCM